MNENQRKRRNPSQLLSLQTLNNNASCGEQRNNLTVATSSSSTTTRMNTPKQIQVSILHSTTYTKLLYQTMKYIHEDRDLLLSSLLYYCGFIRQTPNFFHVVKPKVASRFHLESFHDTNYLDLIECRHYRNEKKVGNHGMNKSGNNDYEQGYDNHDNSSSTNGKTNSMTNNDSQREEKEIEEGISIQNIAQDDGNTDSKTLDSEKYTVRQKDVYTILETYGLVDDCPLPATIGSKINLWHYCLSVAGASLHGAQLLLENKTDVAINFGGGRHHAHKDKAGGFCFVNDVVLAVQRLTSHQSFQHHHSIKNTRVLYLDLDIHHCDGVQTAFYDTNQVLTISFHRYTPGFFPSTSGSINEKGKYRTSGVGYNLNVPMPRSCTNVDFVKMCKRILIQVLPEYDPDFVVVCVGADGLRDDNLVKETFEGWNLTPEGLAECIRIIALECAGKSEVEGGDDNDDANTSSFMYSGSDDTNKKSQKQRKRRKLLILGGGGYNPSHTARTFLLCTAAACEGARPGMLNELPVNIPQHEYFSRYGPSFELYSQLNFDDIRCCDDTHEYTSAEDEYTRTLRKGIEAIYLTHTFLKNRNERENNFGIFSTLDNIEGWDSFNPCVGKVMNSRRRRRKRR